MERSTERDELSPNTRRAIESHARLDIAPWWSTRSLTEIDAGTLDDWTRWLRKKRGLSAKSVRNALGVFHSFLRWLRRVGRFDELPEFPNVHVPEHSPTIISPRTQALILGAIPHERRGAFLALCHGVRPGEARALDIRDVQEREGVPGLLVRKAMKGRARTSPVGSTKTGEAAWIPINDELAEWIAWRRQQRGRAWDGSVLFVNPRGLPAEERGRELRWTHDALRTTWLRACAEVGVDVGLYERTKHSSATAWRSGGMSLEHVRRMLRHRDARSTERYGKLADGALVEAFRRTRKG